MRRRAARLLFVLTSLWLAGGAATAQADEINLYSTREAPLMEPCESRSRSNVSRLRRGHRAMPKICVAKLKLFVVESIAVMHEST